MSADGGPPRRARPAQSGRGLSTRRPTMRTERVSVAGRGTYDGFRHAVAYFEDAVARQPDFAKVSPGSGSAPVSVRRPAVAARGDPEAEAAALRALQLDETAALAHRTLGMILHVLLLAVGRGRQGVPRAPASSAPTLLRLAQRPRGPHPERSCSQRRIAEAERARTLDPLLVQRTHESWRSAYRAAGHARSRDRGIPPRARDHARASVAHTSSSA